MIEPVGFVLTDVLVEGGGDLGIVGVERIRVVTRKPVGQIAHVTHRLARVIEDLHAGIQSFQRGKRTVHSIFAVGFHAQLITLEQFVVVVDHQYGHRCTVSEAMVGLVLEEIGERAEIRQHREHVVGDLGRLEPMREHPAAQQCRQPHPPVIGQLTRRTVQHVKGVVDDGIRVRDTAAAQSPFDLVLAQRPVLGQDRRQLLSRVNHGGHVMPR